MLLDRFIKLKKEDGHDWLLYLHVSFRNITKALIIVEI